jgi:uncharacterized membrane protein YkvA (DUF1232 family)
LAKRIDQITTVEARGGGLDLVKQCQEDPMLFELLDRMNQRIDEIEPREAAPVFADQLLAANPGMFQDLLGDESPDQARWAAEELSLAYLALIKEIPWYVHALVEAANDPYMEPAYRCAIVGSLAYLAQPRDLIPDDLPGGYGLLDDCMLLHVTASECVAYLPRDFTTEERERLLVNFLARAVPADRVDEFLDAVNGVRQLIFHLGLLDPMLVEQTTAAMINDPLVAGPAAEPAEYRDSQPPPGPEYFALPEGGLGVTAEGNIFYSFEDGSVTLRGGEIALSE